MKEEIFPIVDENGSVIGQATRSQCHDGSMFLHPVIHLHIFNNRGDLYLQKRSDKKDIFPLLWDTSVGGHIGLGESVDNAVMREAKEELGLEDFTPVFLTKYIIETQYERELTYCFKTTVDNQLLQPDMDEVSEGCFWNIDEIKNTLGKGTFTPNFESDLKKLFLT